MVSELLSVATAFTAVAGLVAAATLIALGWAESEWRTPIPGGGGERTALVVIAAVPVLLAALWLATELAERILLGRPPSPGGRTSS